MLSWRLVRPPCKSTSFISIVMAWSSTFREKENVVSYMFTVPTTIRFWGIEIPSSLKRVLTLSSDVIAAVRLKYHSASSFFKMGSVVTTPSSPHLRDSTTLKYSAKYCSTGARFISSRQRKYGVSWSSQAFATNFKKSPATNSAFPLTRLT